MSTTCHRGQDGAERTEDYFVENDVLPDIGLYPVAVALAVAHQLPVAFVEKVNVTLPLVDVVPFPVATGVPPQELAYTSRETLAPLMPVPAELATRTARGTL